MHGRAIAEVTIGITDVCFLLRCALTRNWTWLRAGWAPVGLVWWAWLVLCSLPFPVLGLRRGRRRLEPASHRRRPLPGFHGRAGTCRAARESARRWMYGVSGRLRRLHRSALHRAVPHRSQPVRRWVGIAGELTGPFDKPRAGPPLSRILLPVVIPPAALLLARRRPASTVSAYALLLLASCLMVLINQRMPAVLTGFGLAVCALLLPRLRAVMLAALAAGCALVAVSAVVARATWDRLVLQFSGQLEHFGASHYGFLFRRSIVIAEQHPWNGRGFDGFRTRLSAGPLRGISARSRAGAFRGRRCLRAAPAQFLFAGPNGCGNPRPAALLRAGLGVADAARARLVAQSGGAQSRSLRGHP